MLRRALAIVELGAAAVLLFTGYLFVTERRIGGDGIGTGVARMFAVPFMVMAAGVAITALSAWRGGGRWWLWQIAMPVWAAVIILATLIYGFEFAN